MKRFHFKIYWPNILCEIKYILFNSVNANSTLKFLVGLSWPNVIKTFQSKIDCATSSADFCDQCCPHETSSVLLVKRLNSWVFSSGIHVLNEHGCQLLLVFFQKAVDKHAPSLLRTVTTAFADSRTRKPVVNLSGTYSYFGDRCFTAAGPNLWNSLHLRQNDKQFKL